MEAERPRPPETLESDDEKETLRFDQFHVRRELKDLAEFLGESSSRLPNRERVVHLVNELLTLVPPYSEEEERRDEKRRAEDRRAFEDQEIRRERWLED